MSKAWSGGSTRAWRIVRERVLNRDGARGWGCRAHEEGWCERDNAGPHVCRHVGEVAHHTRGRAVTGDDPAHMVNSCEPCNLAIGEPGARTVAEPRNVPITVWGKR